MLSIASQMTSIDDAVQLTASEDSGGSTFAMMGLHGFWGWIETIAPCLHEAFRPGGGTATPLGRSSLPLTPDRGSGGITPPPGRVRENSTSGVS